MDFVLHIERRLKEQIRPLDLFCENSQSKAQNLVDELLQISFNFLDLQYLETADFQTYYF